MKKVKVTVPVQKLAEIFGCSGALDSLDESIIDSVQPYEGEPEYGIEGETPEEFEARLDATRDKAYSDFVWHVCCIAKMIETHSGGSVGARDVGSGEIELTITDPASLLTDLINGVGFFHVDPESDNWDDEGVIKSHLSYLNTFFEIYGHRKPTFQVDI